MNEINPGFYVKLIITRQSWQISKKYFWHHYEKIIGWFIDFTGLRPI